MKLRIIGLAAVTALFIGVLAGCDGTPDSDQTQQKQQEVVLKEATSAVGMPAVVNFRERKELKDIIELRDQADLVTYTYLENEIPAVVHGQTALGGKLTYLGISTGYPIPYATEFTSPAKVINAGTGSDTIPSAGVVVPQADPNGLFSPSSADGTWVLLKDPDGTDVKPVYVEPKCYCSPFKLKFD